MHKLIPLISLLIFTPVMADEIYKWADEDGQIHYSDVPKEGAAEVEIAPIQTFSAPSVTASTASSSNDADANETMVNYESLEITSPAMAKPEPIPWVMLWKISSFSVNGLAFLGSDNFANLFSICSLLEMIQFSSKLI